MTRPTTSQADLDRVEFQDYLRSVLSRIDSLSTEQQSDLLSTIKHLDHLDDVAKAAVDFITFVRLVAKIPGGYKFSSRGQHNQLADSLMEMETGQIDRLTVSMPPRFGKSELCSILFVAWCIGKHPDWKIIQASATDELATDWGRKVKDLIKSPEYQEIFPGIKISKDSSASGKFTISGHYGSYFAIGMGGAIAGKGADLFVVDDLVTEQQALSGDPRVYDKAWTWYQAGPMQRLQPSGRILMVATRWSKADPIGRVKRRMREDPRNADIYRSIEIPALDDNDESNFPELWPTEKLTRKRSNMDAVLWNAQYQQNPTASSTSIIPRIHWRKWDKFRRLPGTDEAEFVTPECFFTLMVWDTAYTKNKRSNPSACTIWGVFAWHNVETGMDEQHVILLCTFKKKMEFGVLKVEAKRLIKEWNPDCILIEAKSSGSALRSELGEARIFAEPVTPKPGEDKTVRLNSVSDVFRSGRVWYVPTAENDAAVQEVNDFPNGEEDDVTDTVAYALRRFRSGGLVKTTNDVENDEEEDQAPVSRNYY